MCGQEFGEGLIPLESFAKKPTMKPGGQQHVDTLYVNHFTDGKLDGVSSLSFKSYEQGRERLQAEAVQVILADERPPRRIYSKLLARTMDTNGIILISYTAVGVAGDDIDAVFFETSAADRLLVIIPSGQIKHICEERREALARELPDEEVETRLHGTPSQGPWSDIPA